MIEEHPSELRADIARYFPGRSLNEFHRLTEDGTAGSMSWLELWEFYQALPLGSMTRAALVGDHDYRRWTETDYMLRELITRIDFGNRIMWAGNQMQGKYPEFPQWPMPDLRSLEDREAEAHAKAEAARKARRFYDSMKPGAQQNTEYAQKLAAAREEHLRRVAEQARREAGEKAPSTGN
ncbi:hypothetical protein ACWDA7_14100 [Streptomyces sp. NPDC001156]